MNNTTTELSISGYPNPSVFKLENENIRIIDITNTIHESIKAYQINCLEFDIEDNMKKKDNKNLFIHCLMIYLWNLLVHNRGYTNILYYNSNLDGVKIYKPLIEKVLNNIPTQSYTSIYSFDEFVKRYNRRDADVISNIDKIKRQPKKPLTKLRMFLIRHGLRFVYDTYYKNYTKVISI
jgi:hypothetical protein